MMVYLIKNIKMYEHQKQLLKSIQSYIELGRTSKLKNLSSKISDLSLSYNLNYQIEQLNFGKITRIIDDYLYNNQSELFLFQLDDIKKYSFEKIENKNIEYIKRQIEIDRLDFFTVTFRNKEYFRHWNNLCRFSVICNKDLVSRIKDYPEINLCVLKSIEKGKLGFYTRFELLTPKDYKEKIKPYKKENSREDYHNDYMDAYENDATNLWNTD